MQYAQIHQLPTGILKHHFFVKLHRKDCLVLLQLNLGVRARGTHLHWRGTDGHAETQNWSISVQREFARVGWKLCIDILIFRKLLQWNVLEKQMCFGSGHNKYQMWVTWVWDCSIRNIPSFDPFCLNMKGWLLMLQKDRSAPRDMQNTNFADNYIVWLSQPFITLSELLGPHVSLSGDGASCGSVISIFPKVQFTVIGNTSMQCMCKAIGFQPCTGVVRK